jgi:hypothetical protein
MMDIPTSGPRKSLLATLALVALAAGPARAQPADEKKSTDNAPPAVSVPAGSSAESQPTDVVQPPAVPPSPAPLPAPVPERPRTSGTLDAVPVTEVPTAGVQAATNSWFTRPPLRLLVGSPNMPWSITFFGVIQADYIVDSTRSYNESIGPTQVARSDTFEGTVGRTQFSMRNTRFGMSLESPAIGGVTPSAVLQGDFAGNQPATPPGLAESAYYNNPTFRIRHAYLALRNRYVDVIAGQTFDVFGWQNYYLLCSLLGLPNQVSSRTPQFRLSHTFGVGGPIQFDVAVSAARPAQRDSQVPDAQGGIRVSVGGWKGITTPGIGTTIAAPLSIGVSGISRQFKVNAFTPPPPQNSNHAVGWGVSLDAFLPVIPAASADDRANRLSLIGSFVTGTGIADLIVAGGGARFPTLPNPAQQNPPPIYNQDIDNGLVTFDVQGVLHTIDWYAFKGGLQYYFPGTGRLFFSGNFTMAHSRNIHLLFPRGGSEIELLGSVANDSISGDGSLVWDATPAVRFGISGQYTQVTYLDGNKPHNIRGIGQALYVF